MSLSCCSYSDGFAVRERQCLLVTRTARLRCITREQCVVEKVAAKLDFSFAWLVLRRYRRLRECFRNIQSKRFGWGRSLRARGGQYEDGDTKYELPCQSVIVPSLFQGAAPDGASTTDQDV